MVAMEGVITGEYSGVLRHSVLDGFGWE